MVREIYEVYAKVVDANGTYNTLSGYPKAFDSRSYNHDLDKTRQRAVGEYHDCIGAMCKNDTRQLQLVMLFRANDGTILDVTHIGAIAEVEAEA